ncbi:MAG: co-chaperone GroES [Candidatus Gracilibacteria bacterium]|jgi:chaperonin GroES|nr:co-chaperone GroES [Candidatus Gracilibacteria bacterium]
MTNILPTSDNIVVEPIIEEKTASGIIIPDTASKEKPMKGTVIAVGPGKLLENGQRGEMEVLAGDTVLFSKYSPTEIKLDGKNLLLLAVNDVYAKII